MNCYCRTFKLYIGIPVNKIKTRETGLYLESPDGSALEAKVGLEVLSDFTNQTLERELADQELRRLLVTTDLSEGDGSGPVPVRLLDTSGGGGRLAGSLGGQLLPGGLASGRLTGGLLGTSHLESWIWVDEFGLNLEEHRKL